MKSQSPEKIVLGKLGSVGRDRGLRDIARALRDAGAEVVYLGLRQTPESFVAAVEQEDPDAVCITSHTSDDLVRELLESLQSAGEGAVATPVIVAGDGGDAGGLRGIGIAAVVETGASSDEIAAQVHQAAGGGRAEGASAGSGQADGNIADLLQQARSGSNRAAGRLLSTLEDGTDAGAELRKLLPDVASDADSADGSHVIGIAGASGAGKSTVCSRLIEAASGKIRGPGRPKKSDAPPRKTAVLSVDASSQRSGGAILGDRIRMTSAIQKPQSSVEENVFFRSAASRGQNGGAWIPDAVKLLEAAEFGLIVVETSGDGHTDSLIAEVADTLVMVVTGDWGDSIQANKAGLLEFADIFVVNKADAQEGDSVCRDLERMLDMGFESSWRPPVIQTAAISGEGTADLWNLIEAHKMYGA